MRNFTFAPLLASLLLLGANAVHAASWNVAELMQMLGQQKSGKATFVEKKYIAMLEQPLESSGELSFTAPDRLEKRTVKPRPESLTLEGDRLLVERSNGRRMTVSLSERPEVAAFVESIRATLAGERSALERFYSLSLTGQAANWQLVLTPTQPRMAQIISQIRIGGVQAAVRTIEFQQADGDRSEMVIQGADLK